MLVAQSCPTLCDHMDDSPPGSSVHGILQARVPEWVATPSPGDFLAQGSSLGLLNCRQILYHLSHQGSPEGTGCQVTSGVLAKVWLALDPLYPWAHPAVTSGAPNVYLGLMYLVVGANPM